MSTITTRNKTQMGMIGAALVGGMLLAGSVFAAQPLTQGYMLASADQVTKTAEGKCGEGKCGDASMTRTDTDKDGKVSRAEFTVVAGEHAADFDKIDLNHDGFIDEAEAYKNVKSTYEANGKKMPDGVFSNYSKQS